MSVRAVGVEQELLLVDPATGQTKAVSHRVVDQYDGAERPRAGEAGTGVDVEQEFFLEQIETGTAACRSIDELVTELVAGRQALARATESLGVVPVAVAAPVLADADTATLTPEDRYRRLMTTFGEIGRQALVCGMHVHVDVEEEDEAVAVADGLRPWLPLLLAISANSPVWRGVDTGYASFRSQIWGRFPSAGPAEAYQDPQTLAAISQVFLDSGAALDAGSLYFDVRPTRYGTVEVRVCDMCTSVDDIALIAALVRALVDTVASDRRHAASVPRVRTDVLKAAHWRAARVGIADRLLDPFSRRLVPARSALDDLVQYTRPALEASGDLADVMRRVTLLLAHGSGAVRQRAVHEATGDLRAVVRDVAERTLRSPAGAV